MPAAAGGETSREGSEAAAPLVPSPAPRARAAPGARGAWESRSPVAPGNSDGRGRECWQRRHDRLVGDRGRGRARLPVRGGSDGRSRARSRIRAGRARLGVLSRRWPAVPSGVVRAATWPAERRARPRAAVAGVTSGDGCAGGGEQARSLAPAGSYSPLPAAPGRGAVGARDRSTTTPPTATLATTAPLLPSIRRRPAAHEAGCARGRGERRG